MFSCQRTNRVAGTDETPTLTELDQYDYDLPKQLIAQHPLQVRSDARLLVVRRESGSLEHHHVRHLPEILAPRDTLVVNNTRVLPARLVGLRTQTGGRWEGLFLSAQPEGTWKILGKTRGRLSPGETITLLDRQGREAGELVLLARLNNGVWGVRPPLGIETESYLTQVGRIPLPPYIRGGEMEEADLRRYQTVYAKEPGSVAAPTAGLHFTPQLLDECRKAKIGLEHVTLHVGLDTFRPIQTDSLAEHPMHSEWGELVGDAAERLNSARMAGGRIVAVGTTSVRVLETAAAAGQLAAWSGFTELFIRPGHAFRGVDALLTNFHLPRTTLLVLVSTFAGADLIRRAYAEAVREEYRFYSYGDAMLIL